MKQSQPRLSENARCNTGLASLAAALLMAASGAAVASQAVGGTIGTVVEPKVSHVTHGPATTPAPAGKATTAHTPAKAASSTKH